MKFKISVGVTGFEPATSWSQTRHSSQAEPHPVICLYAFLFFCLTRDIFYNFYFCLSSTFFTFFNIFCCHFIFPLCFRLIAFNVLYHTIVFLFCQHLFSKKFKQFQKFQTILIFTVFAAIFSHLLSNAAFLLFQECLRHCCCAVYVIHHMTYSSVHLCNPPEAISDGRWIPVTDTSLLPAADRNGSHLSSDITIPVLILLQNLFYKV